MTDITIKTLSEDDYARWDSFVERCPEATFFHQSGWHRVIETIGHQAYFLYLERQGEIEGILPLGLVDSFLFGKSLISTPFCVYGGIAAFSDDAREQLDQYACNLGKQLGVDAVDFRNRIDSGRGRHKQDLYYTFRKDISSVDEDNLQAIPRKQRAMVRKGIKAGFTRQIDKDPYRFYPLYSESVRNLGTPVMPVSFYELLLSVFGDQVEIVTIELQGKAVCSVLNFYFRNEIMPYYGGGGDAARQLKANDLMYWEVMKRAVERGVKVFDFGRSKRETGSFRFKTHWGFEPIPLNYECLLVNAEQPPNLNPTNPKYRYFISTWKHLPLKVSQMIGPILAKDLV